MLIQKHTVKANSLSLAKSSQAAFYLLKTRLKAETNEQQLKAAHSSSRIGSPVVNLVMC